MNIGKACAIFTQLDSDKYTDDEKVMAIYEVMNMETHNSITKKQLIQAIRWLWYANYKWASDITKGATT